MKKHKTTCNLHDDVIETWPHYFSHKANLTYNMAKKRTQISFFKFRYHFINQHNISEKTTHCKTLRKVKGSFEKANGIRSNWKFPRTKTQYKFISIKIVRLRSMKLKSRFRMKLDKKRIGCSSHPVEEKVILKPCTV